MTYKEFFALAEKKGIEKIQITEETKKDNSVYFINQQLADYTDSEKITYQIKAEIAGKTEQLHTEYLDESIIDLMIEKINTTDSNYADEYLSKKENDNIDKQPDINITKEIEIIKELSNKIEEYPYAKSIEIAYGEAYYKTRIINNQNVDITKDSHYYDLYVEGSAEKKDVISSYSNSILVNDKSRINFLNIIKNVLDLATLATTKRKLETKKYNVILSNEVASKIINHLPNMLSAENIHQKKSCLENKLNEKVFSDKLTIVEEPKNKEYPGYSIFDKEGTNTINKELIKNGIIKNYLYDIKEAKIDNISSTGNKYNSIFVKNMYIIPGTKTEEELFKTIDKGIYITDYMGSQGSSINTTSGNISMQVFGYIIENGKLVCGFEPAVLTTTIFELLTNIEEIGNNLKFVMDTAASPSLYIKDISIAGE